MSSFVCEHGMPSRASCVDCMFERGLGVRPPKGHRGIYATCADLVRQGVPDGDVPGKVAAGLNAEDREQLVLMALGIYAAQARRAADAEARRAAARQAPARHKQAAAVKKFWAQAKADGFTNLGAWRQWQSETWRSQPVALGAGRRVSRGEMTADDLRTKIAQLTAQRNGLDRSRAMFEEQLTFLEDRQVRCLNDLFLALEATV